MADRVPVRGTIAPGFEPVAETFRETFERGAELGAACAVYHRGEPVVDLYGGYRDLARTDPWTPDTRVLLFSTTKGVSATAMAHAHAAGLFDYDDRVAAHWPAFGQAGKGEVTVRELLGHRAGVAGIEATLTPERVADREWLVDLLAEKEPDWEPGTRHGYHAWSLGWYESELLRRADPAGRTLGAYFAEEIATPLGLGVTIGYPDERPADRVAEVRGFHPAAMVTSLGGFPPGMLLALANPWSTTTKSLDPFDVGSPADLNDPAWRGLEIPAGNGYARVRDLARLYGLLATGGEAVGLDDATFAALTATPDPPAGGRRDAVLKTETAYSLGFWKPSEAFAFGSETAFGAPGAGGSFAFADPARDLGFAYAPNRMGTHLWDDPRELRLREAVMDCLDGR